MFGLDHDTPDVFLQTARFAVEAGIDLPRFAVVTPFPGTALYQRLEREGRILTRNWELYDGQHVVFQPAQMSVQQLQEGTERAWRHAYSDPVDRAPHAHRRRPRVGRASAPISATAIYAHNLHRFYNCDWIIGRGARTAPAATAPAPVAEAVLESARVARPGDDVRLTLVHPCIGRRPGQRYIRTWQMEPLPPATIAGLTPPDVDVRFYDDRMELIPFDEPTDLVAISVETYTAKRAYQIASEYRRRGVPVVMGGFHADALPGRSRRSTPRRSSSAKPKPSGRRSSTTSGTAGWSRSTARRRGRRLTGLRPDRRIFRGKRYLPVGLVEAGRGCHFKCEFCAVQTVFGATQTRRPIDEIIAEIASIRDTKKLFFFVDDNITSNLAQAKEFFRALIPLGIRWVSQASINAAHDEEFLDRCWRRAAARACSSASKASTRPNLAAMNKSFNTMRGGYEVALANLRRHQLRLYGTFIFGYDADTPDSFRRSVAFARGAPASTSPRSTT